MPQFGLYYLPDEYVAYLNQFQPDKIMKNKLDGHTRPYFGVVLSNQFSYFAPISSPKPKHFEPRFAKDKIDFIRLEGKSKTTGTLVLKAVLNLSRMIPADISMATYVDFKRIADVTYVSLLEIEYRACVKKSEMIMKNASRLYDLVTNRKDANLVWRCCDFALCEKNCADYLDKE